MGQKTSKSPCTKKEYVAQPGKARRAPPHSTPPEVGEVSTSPRFEALKYSPDGASNDPLGLAQSLEEPSVHRSAPPTRNALTDTESGSDDDQDTAKRRREIRKAKSACTTPSKRLNDMPKIRQDFKFGKKLGSGTFATVRLAQRRIDGKLFAVKILEKRKLKKPKQKRALEREVEVLKSICHPNCTLLESIYETEAHLFLVLEYCSGGELYQQIQRQDSFTEAQAMVVVQQVVKALSHLHAKGIVHRDLKPENILFANKTPDSPVKLTDFGLANKLRGEELVFWTACGTMYYAAPEVLSNKPYTYKVDYWSLGVVLYVMLCGYLPFYDRHQYRVRELIARARVEFPDEDWQNISSEAKDLIRGLLQRDPESRFGEDAVLDHSWFRLSRRRVSSSILYGDSLEVTQRRMQEVRKRKQALVEYAADGLLDYTKFRTIQHELQVKPQTLAKMGSFGS